MNCFRYMYLKDLVSSSGMETFTFKIAYVSNDFCLQSNTSECRSGTVVRQKFGEALKSYSLSRYIELQQ